MIPEKQIQRWIFPSICGFIALFVIGASGYEFKYGLKITAPVIEINNPELR